MTQRRPAQVGDAVDAIETPALVVKLDALERNLDAMAREVAAAGLRLRPHAKSHKCVDIAKLQLARGAVGICCQKTDEALAFIEAGIDDVLVTNEVVAPAKLGRLAKASDEHGVLDVDPARAPVLGERIWLIPGHCDPTVNLYDWIVGIRGETVDCVWSVAARGALG